MTGLDQALIGAFLFLTMFGMGAALSPSDFRRVARTPRALLIGLGSQFFWMPLACFVVALGFGLEPAAAIGTLILGCASGGTTSNLFSYYARANLALSISMTVVSTSAAIVAMPLALWLYSRPFSNPDVVVSYNGVITTLVAVVVPVSLGVALNGYNKVAAARAERIGGVAGIAVLALVFAINLWRDHQQLFTYSIEEVICAAILGPIGFTLGLVGATLLRLPPRDRRAVSLETGIQNVPLAIGVILLSLPATTQDVALRVPLLYGVLVVPASGLVALLFRRGEASEQ